MYRRLDLQEAANEEGEDADEGGPGPRRGIRGDDHIGTKRDTVTAHHTGTTRSAGYIDQRLEILILHNLFCNNCLDKYYFA